MLRSNSGRHKGYTGSQVILSFVYASNKPRNRQKVCGPHLLVSSLKTLQRLGDMVVIGAWPLRLVNVG
jgi:hypothetical protein